MPTSPFTARQTVTRTVLVFFTIVAFLSTVIAPLAARAADPNPSASPDATATEAPSTESAVPSPSQPPAATPTIQSDLADYPPGGFVTLTGANWQPAESVHIFVNDDWGSSWSRNVDVAADGEGSVTDQFTLPNWFVATYSVVATGTVSGQARTTFTDAVNTTTSLASSPNPSAQGASVTFTATITCSASCTFPTGSSVRFVDGANNGCNLGTTLATVITLTGSGSTQRQAQFSTSSLAAGSHPVRACFDSGNTSGSNAQSSVSDPATHVVNAPPADTTVTQPTLQLPANGTITTDNTPTFDWSDVADPSTPVSYTLQYAAKGASCTFGSPTTVAGLSASDFTLASSIGPDGFYCWRVKAIDGVGNDSGFTPAFEFRLDTSKPIITATATKADSTSYAANTWTNQNVTVAFTCTDASGFGLSVNTVAGDGLTLTTEMATGSVTSAGTHCVDNAGNEANDATFSPIKIDKTVPVITDLGATSSPNANNWYNHDVTNRFRAADALSGIDAACATAFSELVPANSQSKITSTEGMAVHVTSASCTDLAGNTATAKNSADFQIDKTAPVITDQGPTTPANANGWYKTNVTNEFHATDALSGVDSTCATAFGDTPTYTQSKTTSGEGQHVQVSSDACTDMAGNTAAAIDSAEFKVDQTAPVISVLARNADNSQYTADTWTNQSVTVEFTCGDGGSGVDLDSTGADGGTISSDTATGSFSSDGSHCVDMAGNAATGATFSPIKIDKGAPIITATATKADSSLYVADAWTNQDVTVTFTCSDGTGSGVATDTVSDDDDTLTIETATGSVTSAGTHCVDNAGNEANDATFSPIKIDKTAPVITDQGPTTPANANGWYKTNVTNEFHATDVLSGVDSDCATAFGDTPTYTQSKTTSGEGEHVQVSSDACTDLAGNTADGVPSADFQIDKTAPVITDLGPTTPANANNWHNHDIINTFSAADALSGLGATCLMSFPGLGHTQQVTTSTEGMAVHVTSASCTDLAGNTATAKNSADFQIDKTAPVITDQGPTTPANANGWYKTNVTNKFHATDALSGVDSDCATAFGETPTYTQSKTTSTEGMAVHVTSDACTDLAGNTADGVPSAEFKVDQTAPVITNLGPTTPANGAGWYKTDVINTFSAADALSGVDISCAGNFPGSPAHSQQKTTSGEGMTVHVASDACTDLAGNAAAAVNSADFKVDKTNPAVHISSPANGSTTIALSTSVSGTDGDGLSGISSISVNGVNASESAGSFTAVMVPLNCGANTLTALATDVAGNTKTDSITVTRTCFGNLQYYQPIDQTTSTPVINTGKYGRVIPTKVTFKLDDGTSVTDVVAAARGWIIQIGVNGATCSNGSATDTVEAFADAGQSNAGSNVFRWTTGQWIYNLDTGAPPGIAMAINSCYRLDVYVYDGTNKVKISTGPYALFKPTK